MDTQGLIKLIKDITLKELENGIVRLEVLHAVKEQYEEEERYEMCEGIKQALELYKSKV